MILLTKTIYINNFFFKVKLKNKLTKNIKKYIFILNIINYKHIIIKIFYIKKNLNLIKYIISILMNKNNMFIHIINCFGTKFISYSIGSFNLNKKKLKKIEFLYKLKTLIFLKILLFKNHPLAVHFFNFNLNFSWFLDKLYKKLFLVSIKIFSSVSYNGCKKKKLRKKKYKLNEKVAEWLKALNCKFIEFFFIGSNPIFFL